MRLSEGTAVSDHGGNLAEARRLFARAPEPFLDLSTGINPHPYPLFELPATALTRLPEPARLEELRAIAAVAYGAPSPAHVVAAPGTQILLPQVAWLVPPGRAAVLSPTYAEHARAARLAGHTVAEVSNVEALAGADLAIVVNPNNPDGRVVPRERLLGLAEALRRKGGLLVVDEAFMDVGPRAESLAGEVGQGGIVVLRSFGKFFGLAGVRLGFALAERLLGERLAAELGPWAVAGPAVEYGIRALADLGWQDGMRARLQADAARLDATLAMHGLPVTGGTSLFRHLRSAAATRLFQRLGEQGILVRRFKSRPDELRIGVPGVEADWERLQASLDDWAAAPSREEVPA